MNHKNKNKQQNAEADLQKIANILFSIQKKSVITITELSTAIARVAPIHIKIHKTDA